MAEPVIRASPSAAVPAKRRAPTPAESTDSYEVRAHSVSRGSPLPQLPYLERAEFRNRVFRRDLDRLVQIGALEQVEPADVLLRLRERAVGRARPSPPPRPRRRAGSLRAPRRSARSTCRHIR